MQNFSPNIQIDGSTIYRLTSRGLLWFRSNATGASSTYEAGIMQLLHTINRHITGQILLNEIARNRNRMTIVPVNILDNAMGGPDIRALGSRHPLPQSLSVQIEQDARFPGDPIRNFTGQPVRDAAGNATVGRGTGTNGLVLFNPHYNRNHIGNSNDERLFHEVVHTKHAMEGRFIPAPTHDHFDNVEEFNAVLATDIYLSDKGELFARSTHQFPNRRNLIQSGALGALGMTGETLHNGNSPFAGMGIGIPDTSVSQQYAHTNRHRIIQFFMFDRNLALRLANDARQVVYNPLRDFLAANAWAAGV